METIKLLLTNNKIVLIGMILGLILAYIHWYYWGCYWGTYPFSSECFVNCVYGILTGGFLTSIINLQKQEYEDCIIF